MKMQTNVLVLLLCAFISVTVAEETFEDASVKIALKVYDDCSNAEVFSSCLKKKAITFLDRIGRMEKLSLTDGITVVRVANSSNETLNEKEASEKKNATLDELLIDKVSKFVGSRSLQIDLPRMMTSEESDGRASKADLIGRFGSSGFGSSGSGGGGGGGHGGGGGGGGGGGKRKKKKGGMMNGMMMLIAAKMSALMMLSIGGLFLLAKKALITAKIALMISGIIALKKLMGQKQQTRVEDVWASSGGHGGGGGGGGGGGWHSSGGGGGGGGGGWDKKSFRLSSLPYKAYDPEIK